MSADIELKKRLKIAISAAKSAGELTLRFFRNPDLKVDIKADQSPVTEADRQAELHLREIVMEAFPDDAILGEEFGEHPGNSGFKWIFDPIDGTKSFVAGVPLYTTLVAILDQKTGESLAGVIFSPATSEMVYAAIGEGAWYSQNGKKAVPARVSKVSELSKSLFLVTDSGHFSKGRKKDVSNVFLDLQQKSRISRTWGDAYGYLLVATGRAEVMVDPEMSLWDVAALLPIIEEAGGSFSDWNGKKTVHSGEAVATNGLLHEVILAETRGN